MSTQSKPLLIGESRTTRDRDQQRGSVMVLVMIMLVALLSGAAVMLNLQSASTKQVGIVSQSRAALFCAEAGLAEARTTIAAKRDIWPALLDGDVSTNPPWYPMSGDIDDPPDGIADYEVTVMDNDDEIPPANDPLSDKDQRIFIISKCIKYPEMPKEVMELILYTRSSDTYRNQSGQGAGNTGNAN